MNRARGVPAAIDVTVVLVTYNHVSFVGQAVQSVLDQRTSRTVELIVSEDASSDGTREIVQEIATREPRLRLISSATNVRSNEVVARAIRAARGRYLCILDGDDHWVALDKLERQATLLDRDTTLSGCFHNALIIRGNATMPGDERWTPATQKRRIGMADIWRGNPFATCAGMLRTSALNRLGSWYVDLFPITDWPLYVLCTQQGDLLFVDEPVGAYRLHEGGFFSALPSRRKLDMTANFYRRMGGVVGGYGQHAAREGAFLYFFEWAEEYARNGDRLMARACLMHALLTGRPGKGMPWRRWLRLALRTAA